MARKITGLWQRQQCGYEWSKSSRCQRRPRSFSAASIFGFASVDLQPGEQLDRLVEVAAGVERRVDLEAVPHAGLVVVGAVAGRRVHGAGAGFERDVVAEHAERIARVERMAEHQPLHRLAVEASRAA